MFWRISPRDVMKIRLVCLIVLSCMFLGNGGAQDSCTNVDETLEDFKVQTYFLEKATGFNNGLTCSWTLRAVNPASKIAYHFSDVNLGIDDLINVYAGTSTEDPNVLTNFTGTSSSLNVLGTDSPNIHVVLQTGNAMQSTRQSVDAYFMAGSDHSGAVSCINQTLVAGAEPKFLTSPEFPFKYPESKKCSWIISAPESATLELTFHMIDIEAGDSAAKCNYDGLVVYLPGQKDAPELLVCRQNVWVPETHSIDSNEVQLDFTADDSDSYGGFVLSYKAILPPTTTTTPKPTTDPCGRCRGANVCFGSDARDCRMYNICQSKRKQAMRCPFGTFFDANNNICNYPSRVNCGSDPCHVNSALTSYADGHNNCRHYWKCIEGLSTAFCCPYGTGYDSERRQCMPNASCNSTCSLYAQADGPQVTGRVQVVCRNEKSTLRCPSGDVIRVKEAIYGGADPMVCMFEQDTSSCNNVDATKVLGPLCNGKQTCEIHIPSIMSDHCPQIAKQVEVRYVCEAGCKLRPVGVNRLSFYNLASKGTIMTCGPGTRFDQASCGCIGTGEAPQCRLEVQVLFGEVGETIVKNMADSGIHIDGHQVLQVSGYGRFLGSSWIQIPFYNNNDRMSRMFGFQLRVYPLPVDANSPTKQILLSNCQSDHNVQDSASLEVYLNTAEKKIYFRAVNYLDVASVISVPYIDETWSNVLFLFNGQSMFAKLQYVQPETKNLLEATDKAPFSGKIKIGLSPLKIGGCRPNDGVKAYIDEIQMSFCKTRFPDASAGKSAVQNSPPATTVNPITP